MAGLLAGYLARRASVRSAVSGGLTAVGLALASCTLLTAETGPLSMGLALFLGGLGAGLAFTVTADVILSSVPKEQAGAASAVSETAYELGAALGIALLGSIVTGVYRGFPVPEGVPSEVTAAARDSLGGAAQAVETLPEDQSAALLASAQNAFADGFHVAGAVGSVVLLLTAVAAWFLLKGQRLEDGVEHP